MLTPPTSRRCAPGAETVAGADGRTAAARLGLPGRTGLGRRLRAELALPGEVLVNRALEAAKHPWHTSQLYRATLGRHPPDSLRLEPTDVWPGEAERGRRFLTDRIELANSALAAPTPFWAPREADPAWLHELHAFAWVRDLRAVNSEQARRRARDLLADWLARHPGPGDPGAAWHAGVIGRRIAVWLGNQPFLLHGAGTAFTAAVLLSVARQVRHLDRVIPGSLRGAELIAAIKGLILAGACFPDGQVRLRRGLALLETELDRQLHADGGHIARNPSDHLAVLADLTDIRAVLTSGQWSVPESLTAAIESMAPVVKMLRHGDGGLACFNGGREERSAVVDLALHRAGGRTRTQDAAPQSGFQRLNAQRTVLVADAGPPPPPGYDRRAHAAPLAFELSDGADRVIVNCGAYPGHPAWQLPQRATAAHSTLTLAETNAAEILAPNGGLGRQPEHVTCRRETGEGMAWLAMSHDGYRHLFGAVHQRRLFLAPLGDDLRGEDTLTGPAELPFTIRFHLHPSVRVDLASDRETVHVVTTTGAHWHLRAQGATLALADSIYLGGLGVQRTTQIVLSATTGKGDSVVKWAMKRG